MNLHKRVNYSASTGAIISALIIAGGLWLSDGSEAIISALIMRPQRRAEPPGRCIFNTHI